jgi:hypothetical protein
MDVLLRIKQRVLRNAFRFTEKALDEMASDGLDRQDVAEAILSAPRIDKMLRSRSPWRSVGEKLYVIKGFNAEGTFIYTKGRIEKESGGENVYVLISAKVATLAE